MNLHTDKSNLSQKFPIAQPSPVADVDDKVRKVLECLRYNRQRLNRAGTVWDDLREAKKIVQSPKRKLLFWFNQRLISLEKKRVEPIVKWLYRADLFRAIERLSPSIEALGVIAIPLVLFFAAQGYQENLVESERIEQENLKKQEEERLQQQAITDYLNQLSTIFLEIDGDLREPQNERLRTLTRATTITLLHDSLLRGNGKGQVIRFLSEMDLINREVESKSLRLDDGGPTLRLDEANLGEAVIGDINLRSADLSKANLNKAVLLSTDLSEADLSGADLSGADLSGANLRGVNLSDATLISVKGLTQQQLESVYLCNTQLPKDISLDSNRNCDARKR